MIAPISCILAVPWLVVGAGLQSRSGAAGPSASPAFQADVEPILRAKCLTCHRQDGDAPVPLETFEQVRRRGSLVAQVTKSGYMPPWKPAADSPEFIGDRRLSAREKTILQQWVAAGMPEGDAAPSRRASGNGGWIWGTPDLVIELPEYILAAGSSDLFRNFVVRAPFAGTRYVRGLQFRPRSRAVHHANIRIDSTPASADLDHSRSNPRIRGGDSALSAVSRWLLSRMDAGPGSSARRPARVAASGTIGLRRSTPHAIDRASGCGQAAAGPLLLAEATRQSSDNDSARAAGPAYTSR